ncbi:MAG: hypothetical protein HOV66_03000 [Streptomycetaceae bacterium]|jgi:hypothetical protein|nr:hypothetical protein [Streptomycetaceae bacterium]
MSRHVHHIAEDDALWAALRAPGSTGSPIPTDSLVIDVTGHLKHEEDVAPPLVRATATAEQWAALGMVHAPHIGRPPDARLHASDACGTG